MAIKKIKLSDLKEMKGKEALILRGCGGDLKDWQDGVNLMLTEDEILLDGTKFEDVYGFKNGEEICVVFPFEGVHLDVGKLAMWRLKTYQTFGGTWLSDYVENNISEIKPQNQEKFKPDCPLIGADGNVFNLMGLASHTLKQNGMANEAKEMTARVINSGDYSEALNIIGEYVHITDGTEDCGEDYSDDIDMMM